MSTKTSEVRREQNDQPSQGASEETKESTLFGRMRIRIRKEARSGYISPY